MAQNTDSMHPPENKSDNQVPRSPDMVGTSSNSFMDQDLTLLRDDELICMWEHVHSLTKKFVEGMVQIQAHMMIYDSQN